LDLLVQMERAKQPFSRPVLGFYLLLHGELCLLGTDTKSSTFAETRKIGLYPTKQA